MVMKVTLGTRTRGTQTGRRCCGFCQPTLVSKRISAFSAWASAFSRVAVSTRSSRQTLSTAKSKSLQRRHPCRALHSTFDLVVEASSYLRSCTADLVQFHDTCYVSVACARGNAVGPWDQPSWLLSRLLHRTSSFQASSGQRRVTQYATCRVSGPETSGRALARVPSS